MEKNTILAVVLTTIVLIVSFTIQSNYQRERALQREANQLEAERQQTPSVTAIEDFGIADSISEPEQIVIEEVLDEESDIFIDVPQEIKTITVNTNTISVVLTNVGGDMISWKLNDHLDKEEKVDMIFRDNNSSGRAFSIIFGGIGVESESRKTHMIISSDVISDLFHVNEISDLTKEFYRDFVTPQGEKFRLTKRYDFKPNGYMFELTVTIESENNIPDFNGDTYTLIFGPQIGPRFEKLDVYYDFRKYFTHTNGKQREARRNLDRIIEDRPSWAAITGKYFAFIAIPHVAQYNVKFSQSENKGNIPPIKSELHIIRPAVNQRTIADSYKFYLGPKSSTALNVYHTGLNDFGFKDSSLTGVASSGFWAPLVRLLRWMLLLCQRVVINWGAAIILLTLIIKILFFPLTKKSSEATLRMQELAPKIKEIQEKHKGNPQKLNAEMAAFYQKEGYNPLSGCLPMLLQIPIFIGMYQLFNNHFDLRGASFIPGWIPDLSVPEYIVNFPEGFSIPILGWTALRGLPFIYVGSQLLYGKFTQTPGQQTQGQMKMMLYVMPIMFFFILYNVPSGLLLYWIFSNIFTLVQQVIINKYRHSKMALNTAQNPTTVINEPKNKIVPNKKKKRR